MNIGKLNKRIKILKMLPCIDEMGQEIEEKWEETKKVWANIKPLRGKEFWDAKKISAEQTYKIITRCHKDITPDMRIGYQDKILEITSISNVDEGNKTLEIICTEKIELKGEKESGGYQS